MEVRKEALRQSGSSQVGMCVQRMEVWKGALRQSGFSQVGMCVE
jgi:hypothetical protein